MARLSIAEKKEIEEYQEFIEEERKKRKRVVSTKKKITGLLKVMNCPEIRFFLFFSAILSSIVFSIWIWAVNQFG